MRVFNIQSCGNNNKKNQNLIHEEIKSGLKSENASEYFKHGNLDCCNAVSVLCNCVCSYGQ